MIFPLLPMMVLASSPDATPPVKQLWIASQTSHHSARMGSSFTLPSGEILSVSSRFPFNSERVNGVTLGSDETLFYIEGEVSSRPLARVAGEMQQGIYIGAKSLLSQLKANHSLYVEVVNPDESHDETSQTFSWEERAAIQDPFGEKMETPLISPDSILQFLRTISGEIPFTQNDKSIRITERSSARGREGALGYFEGVLRGYGLETKRLCYKSGRFQGCNLEATKWGDSRAEAVLFGAHYDSVTTGGADDNGSGTAALLEIARLLSQKKIDKTLRIVFFDQEEVGIVGSRAYASDLASTSPATKTIAAFTLDMIGYDSDNDGAIHIIDCGRADSIPLTRMVLDSIDSTGSRLSRSDTCTNRSDHSSFWNRGIPSVIVSENFFGKDENPCYHRSCDTTDKINKDYMNRIVQTMVDVAAQTTGAR